MYNILTYIPIDRRLALSKGEDLPTHPQGSALFADISGFTPLTAVYAQALGPRQGAEELLGQINQVYDALITQVHNYRGSVIYFSGDSITCWFEENDERGMLNAEPETIQHSALRATACALAMQQSMSAFTAVQTPNGETVSLTIKIAIAAGEARRFLIGDPAIKQLDLLVGSTLNRMATAESLAHPKEIIASEEVAQLEMVQIQEWRKKGEQQFAVVAGLNQTITPFPWPPLAAGSLLTDEIARAWLLPPVYERLRTGAGQYLSELRPVASLFLKFGGLDFDGDVQVGEKLDVFLRWVQRTVGRYEGYPLEVTAGDKGSYMYMAFGAPVSHEDDAERALMAALTLRELPPEFGFITGLQMGISQGQMRVGPYGSQTRRTYGAIGHETNMAARLMSYAQPGQIVVSQRIVDLISRKRPIEFQYLGPVTVKGNPKPIAAYTVMESKAAVVRRTVVSPTVTQFSDPEPTPFPLIGRQEEQHRLANQLQALFDGESRVMVVEGDVGIGKSRLIQVLLERARGAGITALLGEGNAIEQSTPYYAWRAVFSQLYRLDDRADDLETRQSHVLVQLPPDPGLTKLAPLLNAVVPLDLPENELTREMSGLSRANKTHELLTAVLQQAAEDAPLLIILEDAHWLDSASWALAEVISHTVHPLLLVIVTRPLDTFGGMPALLANPATRHMQLLTLSPQDALTLVCQRLGVSGLPEAVATFITERAEGHPFFSEELAYALRDAHLIEVEQGICRVSPDAGDLNRLNFPNTIEGVITSRIDRLSPAQQLVMKVSSVIGRIFLFRTLHDIHPVEDARSQLPTYLQNLTQLDLTLLETPEPDLTYMFKHIITQQVAYNMLLYAHRRDLHHQVAKWYERMYGNNVTDQASLLAYHYYQALELSRPEAGLAAKAIGYAEQAGDQAIHKYANQEAIRFFTSAREIADKLFVQDRQATTAVLPPERRAHWALQLGRAYLGLGRMPESRQYLKEVLGLLGWPIPQTGGWTILGLLGEIGGLFLPKRPSSTNTPLNQSLRMAAQACELLVQLYYQTNEMVLTVYATLHGLNLAERAGDSPELARAYANMSGAMSLIPLHGASRRYERKSRQTLSQLSNIETQMYVDWIGNVHKIYIAAWQEAREGFERALQTATELGDRRTAGFCLSGLSHVALFQGQFRRSLELFERLGQVTAGNNVELYASVFSGKAIILSHWQDKTAETMALLEEGLPLALPSGNTIMEMTYHGYKALIHLRANQLEAAWKEAEITFQRVRAAINASFATVFMYQSLLEVYMTVWEQSLLDETSRAIAQARCVMLLKDFRRYIRAFPFSRPVLFRLQGWHQWLNGRSAKAAQSWRQSIAEAQRLNTRFEEGMGHYEYGRHLPANNPARAEHLNRAIHIFIELEATYDLERVKAVLTSGKG